MDIESGVENPIQMDSESGRDRLQQLFRYAQVGRCVNGVTHDINNLLGAMMAYAELVDTENNLSEDAHRMLGEIVETSSKCAKLLNNLTAIARDHKLSVRIVVIATVIEQAVAVRAYPMRIGQIRFESVVQGGISSIVGDPAKIQLAIIYLLMNAEEAVADEKDKRIRLRVEDTAEGVLIEVWNTGPPIAECLQETIFDKHHTHKEGHHLGLGLPEARAIAVLHGGTLTYDEEDGFQMILLRDNPLQEFL